MGSAGPAFFKAFKQLVNDFDSLNLDWEWKVQAVTSGKRPWDKL